MSFRTIILKELYKFYELRWPNNYILADALNCFSPRNEKFLVAVNGLLKEELIKGVNSGIEQRLAIVINPEKIKSIQKIIRNWYEDVVFDADGLSRGVYLYRLTTPTFSEAKPMVVLK